MGNTSSPSATPRRGLFQSGEKKNKKKRKAETPPTVSTAVDEGIVVEQDGDEIFYEVEAIVGRKRNKKKILYQVKWKGCDEITWEPAENLSDTAYADAMEFDKQQSNKKQRTTTKKTMSTGKTKKKAAASKDIIEDNEDDDTNEEAKEDSKKGGDSAKDKDGTKEKDPGQTTVEK